MCIDAEERLRHSWTSDTLIINTASQAEHDGWFTAVPVHDGNRTKTKWYADEATDGHQEATRHLVTAANGNSRHDGSNVEDNSLLGRARAVSKSAATALQAVVSRIESRNKRLEVEEIKVYEGRSLSALCIPACSHDLAAPRSSP